MNFEGQISLTKRINFSFISKLIGEREIVKWEYLLNQDPNLSNYETKELPIYYKLNLNVNYKLLDEFDLNVLFELNDRNGIWAKSTMLRCGSLNDVFIPLKQKITWLFPSLAKYSAALRDSLNEIPNQIGRAHV